MNKGSVIITAGGMGTRMGQQIPKQFIELNGKPILMYAIEKFAHLLPDYKLILTLPQNEIAAWKKLRKKHDFIIDHLVIAGGEQRFHSVKNALERAEGTIVLIHDGVRPFINEKLLKNILTAVQPGQGVVPVIPPVDSLRVGDMDESTHVDRSTIHCVQTPQAFIREEIVKAYDVKFSSSFTDDASVFEVYGKKIQLVMGEQMNIKITHPQDIHLAELYIQNNQ